MASNESLANRSVASAISSTWVNWNDSTFDSASVCSSNFASAGLSSTTSRRMGDERMSGFFPMTEGSQNVPSPFGRG